MKHLTNRSTGHIARLSPGLHPQPARQPRSAGGLKRYVAEETLVALSRLTSAEIAIVGECLRAVAYGPFPPDEEFHTLMGVTRQEAQRVADRFPDVDEYDDEAHSSDDAWLIINNSLVNLLGGAHGMEHEWRKLITATPQEVQEVLTKWRD